MKSGCLPAKPSSTGGLVCKDPEQKSMTPLFRCDQLQQQCNVSCCSAVLCRVWTDICRDFRQFPRIFIWSNNNISVTKCGAVTAVCCTAGKFCSDKDVQSGGNQTCQPPNVKKMCKLNILSWSNGNFPTVFVDIFLPVRSSCSFSLHNVLC